MMQVTCIFYIFDYLQGSDVDWQKTIKFGIIRSYIILVME